MNGAGFCGRLVNILSQRPQWPSGADATQPSWLLRVTLLTNPSPPISVSHNQPRREVYVAERLFTIGALILTDPFVGWPFGPPAK